MAMPTREEIRSALQANMDALIDAVQAAAQKQQSADRLLGATANLEAFAASEPVMSEEQKQQIIEDLKAQMGQESVALQFTEFVVMIGAAAAKAATA